MVSPWEPSKSRSCFGVIGDETNLFWFTNFVSIKQSVELESSSMGKEKENGKEFGEHKDTVKEFDNKTDVLRTTLEARSKSMQPTSHAGKYGLLNFLATLVCRPEV